jgi:hypothetical protein
MPKDYALTRYLVLIGLAFAAANANAKGWELWTERMQCGAVRYQIQSECKKSVDPYTLNECRPQQLRVTYRGKTRIVTLPQLQKSDEEGLKKAGRSIHDFFVTQWTCTGDESAQAAALYYSVGGGTGPYVDIMTIYNSHGNFIEDDRDITFNMLVTERKRMTSVRAIMPD